MRPISSSRSCSSRAPTPCASMASKVTPSTPGAPSFCLAILYAARRVSILQTGTYRPQNRQDGSAFALTYILRLRSCKSMDAFVISSLPAPMSETSQMAVPLRSTDITPLHRTCGPIRHPLAFGRFPGVAGYTAYLAPAISRRDERASPVAQHVLVTVLSLPPRQGEQPYRSVFGCSFCLRPLVVGSALGNTAFRGHNAFTVVTAR